MQPLPKALLDLIEHVELNKSGWWDSALGNVLLAATWMHGKPIYREQIQEIVASAFSLDIPEDRVDKGIQRLLADGKLRATEDNHITPTDVVMDQMEARLKAAELNEDAVRTTFFVNVMDCCTPYSPEKAWTLFVERYFLPLIEILGARTLQFMGGNAAADEDVGALTDQFIELFEPPVRAQLRSAVGNFLDPNDSNVRRYVSEHLDASFLIRASGLTSSAIAGISTFRQRSPTFRLLLDTNFLFSLLELHDNPSNEATQMLGNTIQRVGQHLSIRMNVILPTVDEIKRTLRAAMADLAGMRMSTALADAALDLGISGIAMRFARVNRERPRPLSAHDYFQPYLSDLTPILKSKGIEVYNEKIDKYRERQDVIDDLLEMMGDEEQPKREKQRRYNAALHDSILWHFAHDKRPQVFESPLDAMYWVVTNDYRLINFDRRRRQFEGSPAGVCIHPAELVQMLRLWEPRSTDIEQALMSGLRLPFMFYEYDSGGEAASIRILKALSRFEHIPYLESDAIRDIVLSDAVRSKIVMANSEGEENELIKDALLAERRNVAEERDAAILRAKLAEDALVSERGETKGRAVANSNRPAIAEVRIESLEAEIREAREKVCWGNEKVRSLESLLEEKDIRQRIRSAKIRFTLVRGIVGGILTAVLAAGLGYSMVILDHLPYWAISVSMLIVWLGAWFFFLTTRVQDADVQEWLPVKKLHSLRQRAQKVLASALFVALIGNAIWFALARLYFSE